MIKSIKLSDIPDKLTLEQEKELENLKRPIVDDPEMPKNWKNFTVVRGRDLKRGKARKRVEAIIASDLGGSNE